MSNSDDSAQLLQLLLPWTALQVKVEIAQRRVAEPPNVGLAVSESLKEED